MIKGAKDPPYDTMIDVLGGDRESIVELTPKDSDETGQADDTPQNGRPDGRSTNPMLEKYLARRTT